MTITACNYVTQATRCLRKNYIPNSKAFGFEKDSMAVREVVKRMQFVPHFVMPDNGRIIDDKLKGLRDCEAILPYDRMTVEYFVPPPPASESLNPMTPMVVPKRLVYTEMIDLEKLIPSLTKEQREIAEKRIELAGKNFISVMAFNFYEGYWIPIPMGVYVISLWDYEEENARKIPSLLDQGPNGINIRIVPLPWCEQTCDRIKAEEHGTASLFHDINHEMITVLELCEALSCSNVISATIPKTNMKRKKRGNLRRYETKVLMIKTPITIKQGIRGNNKSDRNGPRQHLRRGHVRRLPSGLKTWVTSCVVGREDKGFVDKDYTIC